MGKHVQPLSATLAVGFRLPAVLDPAGFPTHSCSLAHKTRCLVACCLKPEIRNPKFKIRNPRIVPLRFF